MRFFVEGNAPKGVEPESVARWFAEKIAIYSENLPTNVLLRTVFDHNCRISKNEGAFLTSLESEGHDRNDSNFMGYGLSADNKLELANLGCNGSNVIWARPALTVKPLPFQKPHGKSVSAVLVLDERAYKPFAPQIYVQNDKSIRRQGLFGVVLARHF